MILSAQSHLIHYLVRVRLAISISALMELVASQDSMKICCPFKLSLFNVTLLDHIAFLMRTSKFEYLQQRALHCLLTSVSHKQYTICKNVFHQQTSESIATSLIQSLCGERKKHLLLR